METEKCADRPLLVEGVSKFYEHRTVLEDIRFSLEPGEIMVLAGGNGAGKTTLLKILVGLLLPDAGQVTICGESLRETPRRTRRLVGYVPEQFGVYDSMRGQEYLEYYAAAYGLTGIMARKRIEILMEWLSLEKARDQYLDLMSSGMKQRFSLARSLIHDPQVLLYDEPLKGLDPEGCYDFCNRIRKLAREGKAVLISSHNLAQLEEVCTSIGFMKDGRLPAKEKIGALLGRARRESPLLIKLANPSQVPQTVALLQGLPYVRSASIWEQQIQLCFADQQDHEQEILRLLLREQIATLFFGTKKVGLMELFLQMNRSHEQGGGSGAKSGI